jgi:DNA repair protein RadA/Sms
MATPKKQFICENCGNVTLKWQGKCPQCGEWNTLTEQIQKTSSNGSRTGPIGAVQQLADVSTKNQSRFSS